MVLGLSIIGEDMFSFTGKNSLIPLRVKKSAIKCNIYPVVNPKYIEFNWYSDVTNLTIQENNKKPIMLWVKPLWFDVPIRKLSIPKSLNTKLPLNKNKQANPAVKAK